MASIISQLHEIIEFNYDITDINKFAEDYGKGMNMTSEEILSCFKIIESTDDMPVEAEILKSHYNKPLTVKNLQKVFNMKEGEYKADGNDVEFVSYNFFKRFLSMVDYEKWSGLQKIESIISVDVIKKSVKLSSTTKAKNIFLGVIVESKEDNVVKVEFIKVKKTKMSELPGMVKDRNILLQFTFDKDVDSVKVFSDLVKNMFLEKVDIIDRKKEREIDGKNIKIKESLDSMDKEERKLKEKDMLLKHTRVTMKSLNIQVKSALVSYPDEESFTTAELIKVITQELSKYVTVEILNKDEVNECKPVIRNDNEENDKEEDGEDDDSDNDAFGL